MDRKVFLKELYIALEHLPEEEKRSAMSYYNEYLDDAGPENEEQALKDLGSVREIAARINAEFAMKEMAENPKSAVKGINAVLLVLVAIFTSPITIPLAICVLALAFAVFMVVISVIFSLWAVSISAVVGGLGLAVGIFLESYTLNAGIIMTAVGFGLASVGFGILFGFFCFWISKCLIRGVAYLFHKALKRSKKKTPASENYVTPAEGITAEIKENEDAMGEGENKNE